MRNNSKAMFKNYFKVAIKALQRNKLYTGVSLFGISLTLAVLMLAFAVFENELGKNRPLSEKDRILFLTGIKAEKYGRLTETVYDSVRVAGGVKIDTVVTTRINEAETDGTASGGFPAGFSEKYIHSLPGVEATTIFCLAGNMDLVTEDQFFSWGMIYTDVSYWKVFDFEFLEGSPFSKEAVENQARQVILTESAAQKYFGKHDSYQGKTVDWGFNGKFEVTGVVRNPNSTNRNVQADCFFPGSWFDKNFGHDVFGVWQVAVLTNDLPLLKNELRQVETLMSAEGEYDRYSIVAREAADMYAENILGESDRHRGKEIAGLFYGALVLFVMIPLLNLINLNNSRVAERSAEIGVRKAFGATSQNILKQFLFENLIITFMGGVLGCFMAWGAMYLLNTAEFFDSSRMEMKPGLFLTYFLVILIFGCLSGGIPALRISRTRIVNALKTQKL